MVTRMVAIGFLCVPFLGAASASAGPDAPSALFQSLGAGGWTDDKIVQLASAVTTAGATPADAALVRTAILNPIFPAEGRPQPFFDALSEYFDPNRDGRFTREEVRATIETYAARYADLLRESLAQGPSQAFAAGYRTRTWKMLQKLLLLDKTMGEKALAEWRYTAVAPPLPDPAWDKEHTLIDASDFKMRVCAASAKASVVVKFGSTQCADCTLMEHTQGVRLAEEKSRARFSLYKLWWGPNVSPENDALRKAEGVSSSPTFAVYKAGRRYSCGFAFLDGAGQGLDACLAAADKGEPVASSTCAAN